ncbi:MAG: alpha/beta fold hydrolase [Rhodospirillales bacterium]
MTQPPAFAPAHDDEAPQDAIARIEGLSEVCHTAFDGGQMVWHVWGEGTPLVLLHGGYGSWMHWIQNLPVLAGRFQVFAVDMPGFGASGDMPEPHNAEHIAKLVSAGIDEIVPKDKPIHMAGFSFGGIIGGNVAPLQGERLISHTFSGSSGMGLTRNTLEPFVSWRKAEMPEARKEAHRKNLEILMIADPAKIDDLALYIQDWNTQRGRVKSHLIGHADNLSEALSQTKGRLMGLYGNCDAYAKGHLHERVTYLSGFQTNLIFRELEGAGHWGCYESPDAFNKNYFEMIDEVEA